MPLNRININVYTNACGKNAKYTKNLLMYFNAVSLRINKNIKVTGK